MAADNTTHGVNVGSGRFRLPNRLSPTGFVTSVLAAITGNPIRLRNYTTAQRNTLGGTLGAGDKGTLVYDSTLDCVVMWDGSAWKTPDGGTPA